MDVVSAQPVRALLEMSVVAGMAPARLCDGLSFDERSIRRVTRVPWPDYCALVERVADAAGGLDPFEQLMARSYHLSVPATFRGFARALIDRGLLYRAMWKAVDLFPAVHFNYFDLPDGRVRVVLRLVPQARPCLAFFRGNVGVIRGLPGILGLPMAEVEVEEVTDRSLVMLVRPPPSRTLFARARTALERIGARARTTAQPTRASRDDAPRLAAAQRSLELTPRQAEVLACVVRGLANKEIAVELDCSEATVEFHLTQLLRKAAVQSRTQLIARFWAEGFGGSNGD